MRLLRLLCLALLLPVTSWAGECPAWMNHEFQRLHSSKTVNFCDLAAGKVVLVVNTASQCGFTPQFKGLEALYQTYKERGLVIIGFPSDSFWQEHDDAAKTATVCYENYGVTFPMLATSAVRGDDANAIFQHLNAEAGAPRWNFYKYLLDKQGNVIKRFGATTKPDDTGLTVEIEALLQ